MAITISPIPAFNDNYIWLLENTSGYATVVDPGDPNPVLALLSERQLTLSNILITHHHMDHTGGIAALKAATGCEVYGPNNPAIAGIDHHLGDGDSLTLYGQMANVITVPGHTLDHIAYWFPDTQDADEASGALFCGDTLFAGGCGRLFEGTAAMMRASLNKLMALPASTRVYCAHEYTLANLAFANAAEADNQALQIRIKESQALRTKGIPTVPSNMGLELATNPFLRVNEPSLRKTLQARQGFSGNDLDAAFGALRSWKDNF